MPTAHLNQALAIKPRIVAMAQAPIELSEYSFEWPAKFEAEKNRLLSLVGEYNYGSIEHVGSTAVPGLIAKPVIDIMFGIKSLEEARSAIEILSNNGYCYFPYKGDVMHWFCRPSNEFRTHHLHLVPYEGPLWKERIQFRDALRSDISLAAEYAELKSRLAIQHKSDREKYTLEKWPFINKVLSCA